MELYRIESAFKVGVVYVIADSYSDAEHLFKSKYRDNYDITKIERLGPVLMRR